MVSICFGKWFGECFNVDLEKEEDVQREQHVLQERKKRVQKKLDKERCENM